MGNVAVVCVVVECVVVEDFGLLCAWLFFVRVYFVVGDVAVA